MTYEPINIINGIEFEIFGNENVLNYSILDKKSNGIFVPELYDNQEPKQNGLIDPRMGTTNDNILCNTCNLSSKYCIGHFGHINLETPIYHIGYFQYVKKILECVCIKCSSLRTNKTNEELLELIGNKHGIARFKEIKNITKDTKQCLKPGSNCNAPLPKIKQDLVKSQAKLDLIAEYDMGNEKPLRQILSPLQCYDILQKITPETCILLGINPNKTRPEQMIYRVFPVPPVAVRPSVRVEGLSYTRDDDLTKQLSAIVKSNNRVAKSKSSSKLTIKQNLEQSVKILQLHGAEYIDNESQYIPTSIYKGKSLKSLVSRLKTKEGRFRSNLMGKRIDYCARSVITPDTCISINEIGVPITIAQTLTYPEYVTENNIKQLSIYVQNGRDKYPGANYIIQLKDNVYGKPIDLKYRKQNIELKIGDIVERQLIDGDIVLFNRQPTLHMYSMMGHYVKIINDKKYATFRLNVAVTTPYNADYDGDEMNISIPRTVQTKIELEELTSVEKLLINAQTSLSLMGCKMDTVVGVYILTFYDIKIPRKNVINMLSYIEQPIDKQENNNINKEYYTGKELISFILPKKININDDDITIINGILTKGALTSSRLADGKPKSLIRLILELYNDKEAKKFFDNIQKLINQFNMWYGFSTNFSDITYSKDINEKIKNLIKNVITKVNIYITEMENDPSLNTSEIFEETIFNNLNNVRSSIGSLIITNFAENNNIKIIKNSGSSGKVNPDSISKNIAIEAQHATKNGRIQKMDGRRTLPYFCRDLDNSFERGFNQHGFLQGLSYPEFVFNNITAREGLINIQLKTAQSGYIQHRLTKNMEDFYIAYDRTVRNINGDIIQYSYSDSGNNSTKQFAYNMKILEENNNIVESKYIFSESDIKKYKFDKQLNNKFYNKLIKLRNNMRKLQLQTRTEFNEFSSAIKFMLPININKIKSLIITQKNSNLTPEYILSELKKFINNINILLNNHKKHSIKKDNKSFKKALTLAIYEIFAPKRCIFEYVINIENFNEILHELDLDLKRNLTEPGEMIGIIAGQSICENITQTSLRSHHLTGVSSKTAANSGVDRIIELINNTKYIKTPRMIIRFKEEFKKNDKFAQQIKNHIKQTILSEIRDKIEVYYDPEKQFEQQDNIMNYIENKTNNEKSKNTDLKWLIRIEFNKEELLNKNIELLDIVTQFDNVWTNRSEIIKKKSKEFKSINESIINCKCYSNNDNNIIPIIHIRFDMINYNMTILHNFVDLLIENIKLKGIKNIKESEINQSPMILFDNETQSLNKDQKEYIITTAGINIEELRLIKGIDLDRLLINDINVIYNLYGIEAARFAILDELMALTNNSVNYNHLSVLVDYMTKDGFILSIDRNGLAKTNASLLNKISFEKPIDQLINAAIFNEFDEIKGVSSRIMTGRNIKGGTGICDLIFNTEMVLNSERIIGNEYKNYIDNENDNLIKDILNNDDIDDIFIPE